MLTKISVWNDEVKNKFLFMVRWKNINNKNNIEDYNKFNKNLWKLIYIFMMIVNTYYIFINYII